MSFMWQKCWHAAMLMSCCLIFAVRHYTTHITIWLGKKPDCALQLHHIVANVFLFICNIVPPPNTPHSSIKVVQRPSARSLAYFICNFTRKCKLRCFILNDNVLASNECNNLRQHQLLWCKWENWDCHLGGRKNVATHETKCRRLHLTMFHIWQLVVFLCCCSNATEQWFIYFVDDRN